MNVGLNQLYHLPALRTVNNQVVASCTYFLTWRRAMTSLIKRIINEYFSDSNVSRNHLRILLKAGSDSGGLGGV